MPYNEIPEEAGLIWYTHGQCKKMPPKHLIITMTNRLFKLIKIYQMNKKKKGVGSNNRLLRELVSDIDYN